MKKIFFALLIITLGCKNDKDDEVSLSNTCSSLGTSNDTLTVENYKLYLIVQTGTFGTIEIVDENNNKIFVSNEFTINLIQLQNGDKCWETSNIQKRISSSEDVYSATYIGPPSWTNDTNTRATIKLTISGNQYFLTDKQVNK